MTFLTVAPLIKIACGHGRLDCGQMRRHKLPAMRVTLRPNIMTTPTAAAITDATGIIVSGPI
jgi:hypothetical protein